MLSLKVLCPKVFVGPKNFVSKIIRILKNFGSKKKSSPKRILDLFHFGSIKNFEFQKTFVRRSKCQKKNFQCINKKILGLKIFFGPNKFMPPKYWIQTSQWPMASDRQFPRNLTLKVGQNWCSNSWRHIADMDKCCRVKCCLNKCHWDSQHLFNLVPES